jgi:hypothetical protein
MDSNTYVCDNGCTVEMGDQGGVSCPGSGGGDPGDDGGGGGDDPPPPSCDPATQDCPEEVPPPWEDAENLPTAAPDCSDPQTVLEIKAYCGGRVPAGDELTRMNNALQRIRGRGAACTGVADAATALIAAGTLRIFTPSADTPFGGAAPTGGDWAILSAEFLTTFETTKDSRGLNLDGAITHEMDHHRANIVPGATDSRGHLLENGVPNPYHTLNSKQCGG